MSTRVLSLRRYPVKSMGGEYLGAVEFDARGMVGDRRCAVVDADGHLASGKSTARFRRYDPVFDYSALTSGNGEIVVRRGGSEWRVGEPSLNAELSAAFGADVQVREEDGVPHHDEGAVSLISTGTLDWCAQNLDVDLDPRRLRVNIVIENDEPFIEESWLGNTVAIGDSVLRIAKRIPRCRMVDIRQDGFAPEKPLLKPLARQRDMCLAVYADVIRPGAVTVGAPVSAAQTASSRG